MFNFLLAQSQLPGVYVTEMHPLLIFFFGILIGGLMLLILAATFWARQRKQKDDELALITQGFVSERLQTEAILNDIGLGVLAFAADGRLRIANRTATDLLEMAEAPGTLAEFLSAFGEENGLKTRALLGTGKSQAELTIGKRSIVLQVTESSDADAGKIATIVLAQDVTRQQEDERQRKEFVANVSHELKTPLTIIKTYSESLLDWGLEEKSPEAVKSDLQRILDDVNRMEALIKDLLLLSSIDSRGKAMHMEETDPAQLVRQIVDRCQIQAKEKSITLASYVVSSIPKVFIDRAAMDRAIMNIIQNAIKYTDPEGRIDVFISRMWDDVIVKIKDNGQGIDPKHQKAIFDRFYRVDTTGSRKYGGTGLGLSIAKELTELHHGKISVSSVPTQGSEFAINLPSAGKIYRQVMLQLVQKSSRSVDDILMKQAHNELLQQAHEAGMEAASLQDLTRSEREQLMQPYRKAEEADDTAEDFAGVLSAGREPAETQPAAPNEPETNTVKTENEAAPEENEPKDPEDPESNSEDNQELKHESDPGDTV